ncbi:MAG: thioredoxin-like domain-containing protein, partial [Fermentimonas sp.]|nr:thioredoxin-like domain-containing protein [Fermentimonas sp.]
DYEGDTISSYDYKGKYLLLSFISTSGVESRETIDLLKNEYDQLNSDSVQFVSVYIDSDIYPIDYPAHDSVTWTIIPEKRSWGSDIVDLLNVQYVPFNILVRPDGTIMERNVPAQEVAEVVRKSIDN